MYLCINTDTPFAFVVFHLSISLPVVRWNPFDYDKAVRTQQLVLIHQSDWSSVVPRAFVFSKSVWTRHGGHVEKRRNLFDIK